VQVHAFNISILALSQLYFTNEGLTSFSSSFHARFLCLFSRALYTSSVHPSNKVTLDLNIGAFVHHGNTVVIGHWSL
jgi:serine acetyltransferase